MQHYSYHFNHKGAMWWATERARSTGIRYSVKTVRKTNRKFKNSKFIVTPVKEDRKNDR